MSLPRTPARPAQRTAKVPQPTRGSALAAAPITPLAPALQRVAQHIAEGLTYQEIVDATGLSVKTVRQYVRDIRESIHCPPRCKQPVLLHRLFTTQQATPPTTDRPAPQLTPAQEVLLRAVAEHSSGRDIAAALSIPHADLPAMLDQLLNEMGARDTTQLVILAHGWELLTAEPAPHARGVTVQ
ncbi:DNA-binding protein [Streptomyces sp. NPDC058417]|uniref:DNA-binding protein n=1 Tax=unclassified Streptomyces TaxID=2593676 RepID=UPI003646CF26